MRKISNDAVKGLLLDLRLRKAGDGVDNTGKKFSWDDAWQIVFLPFEEEQTKKLTVDDEAVDEIVKVIDDVCWGALIELSLTDKKVSSIKLLDDCLKNYYDNL